MWLQRSKVQWAKLGDKNSKYFHARATQRFKRNSINALKKDDDTWCQNLDEVAETIMNYYKELFHSANPTSMENTTQFINTVITEEMNAKLVARFEASEIHDAIKEMAPLKAPGPDGMPPIFLSVLLGFIR